MGDIYSLADRVAVWLGPEKDNSADVLHLLSHLSSEIKVDYLSGTMTPASSVSAVKISDMGSVLPYSSDDAWGIDALISRPGSQGFGCGKKSGSQETIQSSFAVRTLFLGRLSARPSSA